MVDECFAERQAPIGIADRNLVGAGDSGNKLTRLFGAM